MQRLYIIILLAIYVKSAIAQSDSTLLEYYPLKIGNYWEYEDKFEDFFKDTIFYNYFSLEVIGDTIMANQQRYQILIKKSIPDTMLHDCIYERIDSMTFNIYRYDSDNVLLCSDELFIDSLKLILIGGEFIGVSRLGNIPFTPIRYLGFTEENILDSIIKLHHFYANDMISAFGYDYWFAEGLGLVRGFRKETFWHNPITLFYARINGKSNGHPVSVKKTFIRDMNFILYQNFPNPFNQSTTIKYELPSDGKVELNLYNIFGQKIRTLFKGFQTSGIHNIELQVRSLSTGLYIYEIKFGTLVVRKRLILQK